MGALSKIFLVKEFALQWRGRMHALHLHGGTYFRVSSEARARAASGPRSSVYSRERG